jgi:hypothetical protein
MPKARRRRFEVADEGGCEAARIWRGSQDTIRRTVTVILVTHFTSTPFDICSRIPSSLSPLIRGLFIFSLTLRLASLSPLPR